MQGMLAQAQQGAGQPMPGRHVPVAGQQAEQPQGNPQQQEMYDIVVGQGAEWIYGDGMSAVQQRLQISEDPADDIGDVVANVLLMQLESASGQGKSIPPQIMVQAAMELSAIVSEIASKLGRMPVEQTDREAVEGFYEAMRQLGQKAKQYLSPEDAAKYKELIQVVIQAEEQHLASQPQPAPLDASAAQTGTVPGSVLARPQGGM